MKKAFPFPASNKSIGEAKQSLPSVASQRVADYARSGMTTIYENDKATENEALEQASPSQEKMDPRGRA